VLIVDDNEDAAEVLEDYLRMSGHETGVAHDGPQAIERAAAFLPEFVLLDIGLPAMDGYEVARRIRADPRLSNIILVALTGYGQEADRRLSREAGFDEHLVKPVNFETIDGLLAHGNATPDDQGVTKSSARSGSS
jgi:two-component system CheB/CheR fusion protein